MTFQTDKEIKQVPLKYCNYLQILNVPDGVKAYISTSTSFNINKAYNVSTGDILEALEGTQLDNNKDFYLSTVGTNENSILEIETKSLNSKTDWVRHRQGSVIANFKDSTRKTFEQIEEHLNNNLQNIDASKCFKKILAPNEIFSFDTTNYKYARISAKHEFEVLINDASIYFLDDEINLSKLNSIQIKNNLSENLLNVWGA